jgi:hypothetical protein
VKDLKELKGIDKEIEMHWKNFVDLLESTKREHIEDVIKYLKEREFYLQPASSRHHLAEEGGLLKHSLNVYHTFSSMNRVLNLAIPEDTIILTSLLHDLCKIDVYKENTSRDKKYRPYYYYDPYPFGHGEKSVVLLLKLKLKLSELEELMIRWHMGVLDNNIGFVEKTLRKKYPEAILLFTADYIASQIIET